jgi:DNA-binding MarR family transcriptional regulator
LNQVEQIPIKNLITTGNPVVDFLMRLKAMDEQYLDPRDILCLYTIICKPGIHRDALAKTLGLNAGANVLTNVRRLIKRGFIEDRRDESRRANPSLFYALPAGVTYWLALKP